MLTALLLALQALQGQHSVLIDVMTNRSTVAVAKLSHHHALAALPDDKKDQVLTARGLLACGLLVHCLQSRHRVNYGVNRCG